MAFPLLPLLFLGGAVLVIRSRSGSAAAPAPAPAPAPATGAPPQPENPYSKLPPKEEPKALPTALPKTDGVCIVPQQNDLSNLPNEPFWDVYKYTLLMDSDPASLEAFAKSCDAVCQPVAAKALRDKAAALKSAGVPDGYDPNGGKLPKLPDISIPGLPAAIPVPPGYDPKVIGMPGLPALPGDLFNPESPIHFPMPSVPFPVPGAETTPEPAPGTYVPTGAPGAENATPEIDPKKPLGGLSTAPKKGYRSPDHWQWWHGPLKPGQSPWSITQYLTGDGRRYPELMPANPEKATVGKPGTPGYTFATFKIGERIRIPKTWNKYIDQLGNADQKGGVWPEDPAVGIKV